MRLPTQDSSDTSLDITRTHIDYDPTLSRRSGLLAITDGAPPLAEPHGDTLLHLLFFAVYTGEGRQLLLNNTASDPEVTRQQLTTELRKKFPAIADERLDVFVEAHLAATAYVAAYRAHDAEGKLTWETVYSQKLLPLLAGLHDDAMAHEFSMIW